MSTLTLRQQFVEVARRVPGFVLGGPTRMVLRLHGPVDMSEKGDGTGPAMCLSHRRPVEWPCRDWLDADETLARNPGWRL